MRILIVSFSARQDGNCDGISRMIQEHYDHSCTVFPVLPAADSPVRRMPLRVLWKGNDVPIYRRSGIWAAGRYL